LAECLASIRRYTKAPHRVIVADDGSSDGTASFCRDLGVAVVTGPNAGVCWNKNRALYTVRAIFGCDPVFLLEDDCWPSTAGWEAAWCTAVAKFHHVGYALPAWRGRWRVGGDGSPEDPYRTREMTGQCTVTTGKALDEVGYLSSAFLGYGWGHVEWTERFAKAGFVDRKQLPCLRSGLALQRTKTYRNGGDVRRNRDTLFKLRKAPAELPVLPWTSLEEQMRFMHEVKSSLGLPY